MKNTLRHTWAVLHPAEKRKFSLLIAADIIISLLDILSLALLLWIIQFYIQPGQHYDLSFLPGWLADRNSTWLIALFLIFFGVKNLTAYLLARIHYQFIGQVATRITRNNLINYQHGAFEEFINVDSSVHIRKLSFQPFEFGQYILSGIQQIITQVSLITIAVIAVLLFNPKLFLLLLCILLPPVIVIFYFTKKRLTTVKKNIQSSNERSFQYLLDALKGYAEANIYDRHDFFLRRYMGQRKKFSKYLFESISIQNIPSRVIEIFAVLGLFILIAIAKWSGNDNGAALLTIGAFMAAAYKIIPGIVKIINLSGQIKAYEYTVSDLIEKPALVIINSGQKINVAPIHSVEFNAVGFMYKDMPVLNDLSFSLQPGDFAGITGDSGLGKTTILNLLLGFLAPQKGSILINDEVVSKEQIKAYWPFIAYVRQQTFLIHDSILKNITLEEEDHNEQSLQYAIKVSGLEELIGKSPQGIDTVIAENGKNISGGQQQRIALARALYKDAMLIVLDEPFNELDEASVSGILEHFKTLAAKGKIVVMITHDTKSLLACNKIIPVNGKP